MESTIIDQINLFAENLPSMDQIQQFSNFVNSSEHNRQNFTQQVEENISRTGQQAVLATGIGLFILRRYSEAVEKLQKAKDCKEKFIYLASALRRQGQFDQAIENLEKALAHQADPMVINLEKAATYRSASNFDAATKQMKKCSNFENISADYHYQLARLQESQGLYLDAVENYKKALELSPNHSKSLFHLAYRCDLSGDEAAAIDYYKQVITTSPVYTNALLNLSVLYEDAEQHDKALRCIDKVLQYHPNHQRAILFKKDVESSKTMFYDEEKEKRTTHKTQILETPISDFELSVRSRNCLKKMNIHTIGDLLNINEAELLSYKNFGETSLREIKVILDSKALHLGMALEEDQEVLAEDTETTLQDEGLSNKPIDDLQLSVRSRKCLVKLNIRTLGELTRKTEAELLGCKNFGATSMNEIKKALTEIDLSLRNLD
ncbi:DNA-directed RNA polymerase subunit alpha [subsurface metagenome]